MNERIGRSGDDQKITEDITFGAFSNPRLNAVLKHFGKTAFGRSAACMEFEAFIKRMQASGAKLGGTCLEIGTFHGITAVILSQFFDRVICVSLDDNKAKLMKHDIVKFLGIDNIRFFDIANNDEKVKLVNQMDFDFCYSDGDHTNDTLLDFDLVKRCGRVLFHEYWPIQVPVWNLVNSLPQDEIMRANYDCFAYWQEGGFEVEPKPVDAAEAQDAGEQTRQTGRIKRASVGG